MSSQIEKVQQPPIPYSTNLEILEIQILLDQLTKTINALVEAHNAT